MPRIVMVVPSPRAISIRLFWRGRRLPGVTRSIVSVALRPSPRSAYGTESIKPVVKIVGPGNAYVAAAKRQAFGVVGIISIAGPSEVLVIADKHNDPEWIAADLLAQAEHDTAAQSILMTDDAEFASAVEKAVGRQLRNASARKYRGRKLEHVWRGNRSGFA